MAAQETMRREAGAMRDEARAMWDDATDAARSAANRQQQAAAQGIGDFAGALREAARKTDGGDSASSRVAQTIADSLDRVSGSLRGRDLDSLIREVEDFARSQPVLFFGAAIATGFIAMRFLKSSAPVGSDVYREVPASRSSTTGGLAQDSGARRSTGADMTRPADSALSRPDALQAGVGTRPGATRQSHATEFATDAGAMAAHDGGTPRSATDDGDNPARTPAGPRSDTARAGGTTPNVWPETSPVEKDANPPGTQPGSTR